MKLFFAKFNILLIVVYCSFLAYLDASIPQRSTEFGLVYVGKLVYKPDDLMFWSYSELFSSLNVLTAFLLKITGNTFVTGFTIQFFQLLILLLSLYFLINNFLRLELVSLLVIFVISFAIPNIAKEFVSVYPLIFRTEHTYGQFGLSFTLLVITLLVYSKFKWAFFNLGILLGIHTAWALWSGILTIIYIVLVHKKRVFLHIKSNLISLILGSFISIILFAIHKIILANSTYSKLGNRNDTLINSYLTYWDYHRSIPFNFDAVKLNLFLIILLIFLTFVIKIGSKGLKRFNILLLISTLLSVGIYFLNDYILNNSFIPLSLLMPGRFMNLQALTLLPILIINGYFVLKFFLNSLNRFRVVDKYFKRVFTLIFYSVILYLFVFTDSLAKIPFSHSVSALNIYQKSENLCLSLEPNEKKVLTIGNPSRFIPIKCGKSVILDTTAIDFIPYLPNALNSLKTIIDEVYGLDFQDPRKNFELIDSELSQSGSVPENIVKPVWDFRSVQDWQLLACKYDFVNIVTPDYFSLALPLIYSENGYSIYQTKQNCSSDLYPIIAVSRSVERSKTGDPFFWLIDNNASALIFNSSNASSFHNLSFDLFPNPCALPIRLNIIRDNFINSTFLVEDRVLKFESGINLAPGQNLKIDFLVDRNSLFCKVDGDDRQLSVGINNLRLSSSGTTTSID